MEIVIGVKHTTRELRLESSASQDEIAAAVAQTTQNGTPLILSDDKGRKVIVPANALAFVELGDSEPRRVGFGIM